MVIDGMDSVTHPHEGDLQAYLDGELESPNLDDTRLHLEECQRCSESLAELQEMSEATAGALSSLDIATPALRASSTSRAMTLPLSANPPFAL